MSVSQRVICFGECSILNTDLLYRIELVNLSFNFRAFPYRFIHESRTIRDYYAFISSIPYEMCICVCAYGKPVVIVEAVIEWIILDDI